MTQGDNKTNDTERVHVEVDFPLPEKVESLDLDDYRNVLKDEFELFLSVDADISVEFQSELDSSNNTENTNPLVGRSDGNLERRTCEYQDDCERKVDLRAEVHEDGVFSAPSEKIRICAQHIRSLDGEKHILIYPPRTSDKYVEPEDERPEQNNSEQ